MLSKREKIKYQTVVTELTNTIVELKEAEWISEMEDKAMNFTRVQQQKEKEFIFLYTFKYFIYLRERER